MNVTALGGGSRTQRNIQRFRIDDAPSTLLNKFLWTCKFRSNPGGGGLDIEIDNVVDNLHVPNFFQRHNSEENANHRFLFFNSAQIPEALFSLVNLAHLSLAGTLLGPTQGEQLEARLRLDSICVNPDAPPSHPPPSQASTTPEQRAEGGSNTPLPVDGRVQLASVRRRVCRSTSVPDQRLHELRDQVRTCVNRRRRDAYDPLSSAFHDKLYRVAR